MLLRILPEAVRRDIVGARNVSTVSILYRLFVGAERTLLLKSLTEVRVGTTLHDVLRTIRLWRRWVGRGIGAERYRSRLFDSHAGAGEDVGCRGEAWRSSSRRTD